MNNTSPTSYFSGRRFMGQVGVLTVANVVARLLSAVGLILIARLLGPEEYGPLAASFALTRVLSVFFNLGLDAWLLREGGETEQSLLGRKSGVMFMVKGGGGLVWLAVLWLIAPWLNQESFPVALFMWCALGVWLEDLALTAGFAFQAALRPKDAAIITVALQFLLLLVTLGMMGLGVQAAVTFAWGRALLAGAAVGWSVWWLSRTFPLQWATADIWPALRGSRGFALSLGLAMLGRQADVSIVANWLGKEAAGYYAPAVTLSSTVLLLAMSLHNILLPTLSQMHQRTPAQLPRTVRQLLWGAGGLGALLWLVVWLTAEWGVVLLFGAEYAPAGRVLQILGLMIWARCWTAVQAAVLAAVHWQRYRVYVQAVGVFLAIVLNIYIVTQTDWGLIGVAWVYVFTEVALLLGYSWYVWRWSQGTMSNSH
ncbi:MAG: oligosaccharide flippase family protein [Chloroflexi bacterium]|nr:oligosaccharide flippase family protein [Chloroflexota bacterium]